MQNSNWDAIFVLNPKNNSLVVDCGSLFGNEFKAYNKDISSKKTTVLKVSLLDTIVPEYSEKRIYNTNECYIVNGPKYRTFDFIRKNILINAQRLTLTERNNIKVGSRFDKEKLNENILLKAGQPLGSFYVNNTNFSTNLFIINLLGVPEINFKLKLEFTNILTSKTKKCLLYIDRNLSRNNKIYKQTKEISLNSNISSFMLAYTNPKLTGNIKLVVDTKYRMYLDTFKVSSVLSNLYYRHREIGYNSNYVKDIKKVFSDIPVQQLFAYPEDVLDMKKIHTNFTEQYVSTYEYGAETNEDFLYSENMKILAPLYIRQNIPDFFVIFKYKDFRYKNIVSDIDKLKEIIKDCEVVQIYDLREHTTIGHYLNTHKKEIKDIISPLYLQFKEQDLDENDIENKFINGENIWEGISIKKGVIVKQKERSYFANEILKEPISQEKYNMFLINGFERNSILYPNIINLEFMFNDDSAKNFEMNNYFGLYLSENDFAQLNSYCSDDTRGNTNYKCNTIDNEECDLDKKIRDLFNKNTDIGSHLLFGITPTTARRIKSYDEYTKFLNDFVLDKPGDNIIRYSGEKLSASDAKSFITLHFSEPIKYGEHFRIVVKNHFDKFAKTYRNFVFEIIASNDTRLAYTKDNIFPYVQTNMFYDNSDLHSDDKITYFARTRNKLRGIEYLKDDYYSGAGDYTIYKLPYLTASNYNPEENFYKYYQFGVNKLSFDSIQTGGMLSPTKNPIIKPPVTFGASVDSLTENPQLYAAPFNNTTTQFDILDRTHTTTVTKIFIKNNNNDSHGIFDRMANFQHIDKIQGGVLLNNIISIDDDTDSGSPYQTYYTGNINDESLFKSGTYDINSDNNDISNDVSKFDVSAFSISYKGYHTNIINNDNEIIIIKDNPLTLSKATDSYEIGYIKNVLEKSLVKFSDTAIKTFERSQRYPEIYRLSFYTQDVYNSDESAVLSEQLKRIEKCIQKFNFNFFVGDINEDSMSIISSEQQIYFQHIDSEIINNNQELNNNTYWLEDEDINKNSASVEYGAPINWQYQIVDYDKEYKSDSISYFNQHLKFVYKPLHWDSELYNQKYSYLFAPYNFELLGWRFSNIVKFANFNKENQYHIKTNLTDKFYNNIIAKTINNNREEYHVLSHYDIVSPVFCVNSYLGNDTNTIDEEDNMIINHQYSNIVISPYNLNYSLICSKYPLVISNQTIGLYEPQKFNMALMGIYGFKSIDSRLDYSEDSSINVNEKIYLPKNSLLRDCEQIKPYQLYKLNKGTFYNVNIDLQDRFIIDSEYNIILVSKSGNNNTISYKNVNSDIVCSSDVEISIILKSDEYSYIVNHDKPKLNTINYINNAKERLNIPVVIGVNSQIEMIGDYYDGNKLLSTKILNDKTYQNNLKFKSGTFKEFNENLLCSVEIDGQTKTIEDIIENNIFFNDNLSLLKYCLYKNNLKSTIAFYNKYSNNIEFVYNGLKFNIMLKTNKDNFFISLESYNNYQVYVINDYDASKNNKIYISTQEHIILIVNHLFKLSDTQKSPDNIFYINNKTLENNINYSWVENSYTLDFYSMFGSGIRAIINKQKKKSKKLSTDFSKAGDTYIQVEYFDIDEKADNNYLAYIRWGFKNAFCKNYDEYLKVPYNINNNFIWMNSDVKGKIEENKNNIYQDKFNIKYEFSKNPDRNILSYVYCLRTYNENNNENFIAKYIDSFDNDWDIFVINNDISKYQNIIRVDISKPKNIKYNYGYADIAFYDLLEFNNIENDILAEYLDNDYLLCNTCLKNVRNINNSAKYKIYSNTNNLSKITKVTSTNWQIIDERCILQSPWSDNYYTEYNSTKINSDIPGYQICADDKSYFGSRCIKISNDNFIISNWSNNNNLIKVNYEVAEHNISTTSKKYEIVEINLEQIFFNQIIKNKTFISNWDEYSHNEEYYKNYINNNIRKFFKFDDKGILTVYSRPKTTKPTKFRSITSNTINSLEKNIIAKNKNSIIDNIVLTRPLDLSQWEIIRNVKTEYVKENSFMFLKIYLENYTQKEFYFEYNCKRS